jgi:hypothetical protein
VRVPYSSRALFGQNIAEFLPRENNASVYDTLTALTTKLDGLSANSQVRSPLRGPPWFAMASLLALGSPLRC